MPRRNRQKLRCIRIAINWLFRGRTPTKRSPVGMNKVVPLIKWARYEWGNLSPFFKKRNEGEGGDTRNGRGYAKSIIPDFPARVLTWRNVRNSGPHFVKPRSAGFAHASTSARGRTTICCFNDYFFLSGVAPRFSWARCWSSFPSLSLSIFEKSFERFPPI